MNGKIVRKIGLVLFLVAYGVSCLFACLMNQLHFFWSLIGLGLVIGGGEIVSVITTGDTLSTNFTKAMQREKKKTVFGAVVIFSLILTMIFLGIHFWPWP